ncbi:MAG: hypothetical protein H6625_01935 [Bdellovibrionaceae bacterium]|nr:hypothetical protein [Pseudobdellovibrionaceae bacterium]
MKNILFIILNFLIAGCVSPQIYIIDRQSVMEAEAGGEWPELDIQLLNVGQKAGPTFFAKTTDKKKQRKLQNVLNGELAEK